MGYSQQQRARRCSDGQQALRPLRKTCAALERSRTRMHARVVRTGAAAAFVLLMTTPTLSATQHDADARLRSIYTSEWQWRGQELADTEGSQRPINDHLA